MANPYKNVKKSPLNQKGFWGRSLTNNLGRQATMLDNAGPHHKRKMLGKYAGWASLLGGPVAAVRYGGSTLVGRMIGNTVKYAIRNPKKTAALLGLSGWLGHETDKANKKANDKIEKGTEATTKNPGF